MPFGWIDTTELSFNSLLLLERIQLSWLPGWLPERELGVALYANPVVEWYMRHKCPELNPWLDGVMGQGGLKAKPKEVRLAELAVLDEMEDLLVYVVDPEQYDNQPFLTWDSTELSGLLDDGAKIVLDIGSGTGRLAFVAAETAQTVFAVEPVENLRRFIKAKAKELGVENVYTVDGLIEDIPFPDAFADVVMGGHVFGDNMQEEYDELLRVTKPGGMVILCPGNNDEDNEVHAFLLEHGFEWSLFEEPEDGWKRKYWVRKGAG